MVMKDIYTTIFLSTPSARRATLTSHAPVLWRGYFYPRPPRGGRLLAQSFCAALDDFYPRPPRGGRLNGIEGFDRFLTISIHALREEGDTR